ncbi:hypothetical protein F5B21DRAFT_493687, partial [Xylaria acuta]
MTITQATSGLLLLINALCSIRSQMSQLTCMRLLYLREIKAWYFGRLIGCHSCCCMVAHDAEYVYTRERKEVMHSLNTMVRLQHVLVCKDVKPT